MRPPTLDPRFLSRSRREQLGLPWPPSGRPTTTQTSPETSPTGCAGTDESGSSSPEQSGTTGAPWWAQDLSHWPGPDADPPDIYTFSFYGRRNGVNSVWERVVRVFEHYADSMTDINKVLNEFIETWRKGEKVYLDAVQLLYTPPGSGYQHGPVPKVKKKKGRPDRTFDRMGRRVR